MFDFLASLPEAQTTGVVSRAPGILIDGAFIGNTLVNVLFGENVPNTTYTVGINGRGSLVMEEQEFRDLLSSMLALFDARQAVA